MAEAWGMSPVEVLGLPYWCLDDWRELRSARQKRDSSRVAEAFKPGEPSKEYLDAMKARDEWEEAMKTCSDWAVDELLEKVGMCQAKMDEHRPAADANCVLVRLALLEVERRLT